MQKKIKKSMCRLISTVLLAVMCLSTMLVYTMEVYAYGDAKQGVVVVAIYAKGLTTVAVDNNGKVLGKLNSYGDTVMGHGTGFFIGKKGESSAYLATNCHVVEDYVNTNKGSTKYIDSGSDTKDGYHIFWNYESLEVRVYYSQNDYEVAEVIDSGKAEAGKVDLAILKLEEPTDKKHALALLVPTEDMVGKDVYAVGFPGLSDNELSDASKWGINDITVTKGVINRLAAANDTGLQTIQTDAQISGGNSGGPLVDEKGNVVGINTWGYNKNGSSTQYAINVSELITMLERNNVPYELASTKTAADVDDNKGDNTALILAGVGAAVVVVIIIAVVVSKGKKKNPQAANTPNIAYAPNASNAAPAVKRTPMIRSLASQHKGACFAVSNTTLFVGRDASVCKITFKEGSVGVSGKHCSIMYREDTNEFVLTDLGSTYGTFLANGQRLQPNIAYRLKSGETFYVGDKANILLVEVK